MSIQMLITLDEGYCMGNNSKNCIQTSVEKRMQNQKTSLFKRLNKDLVMCCMQIQTTPKKQAGRKASIFLKIDLSLVNHLNKQGGG